MKFIAFCSLLGIFVGFAINSALGNFVQRPENENVYLGSVASFTCEIYLSDYDGIVWYATEANTLYNVLPAEYGAAVRTYDLPNNILSSTLSINARETTNNTRVLCKGDRVSGQDIFSTAYMTIQGLTTAPIRFTNASYKYGIELTWSPPFTLPGTEMEFIVEATIATDSLLRLLTSQTHQNVSYSDLNISRCDSNQTVHFSVRGVNEVGEGEAASIILHLTPAESVCDNSEITLTQGRPGQPENFTARVLDSSLFLMWMPPLFFSESETDVVPILYYTIDVFDSNQVLLERENTSELFYSFNKSVLGIAQCFSSFKLQVNVRGVNFAGEGNISTLLWDVTQNDTYCITFTTILGKISQTTEATFTTYSSSELENHLLQGQMLYILVAGGIIAIITLAAIILCVCCLMKKKNKNREELKATSYMIGNNVAYGVAKLSHTGKNGDQLHQLHFYEQIGPVATPIYETVADLSIH